eukprot:scaffold7981_cov49-Phaeocystis_antarctica.AAC.2
MVSGASKVDLAWMALRSTTPGKLGEKRRMTGEKVRLPCTVAYLTGTMSGPLSVAKLSAPLADSSVGPELSSTCSVADAPASRTSSGKPSEEAVPIRPPSTAEPPTADAAMVLPSRSSTASSRTRTALDSVELTPERRTGSGFGFLRYIVQTRRSDMASLPKSMTSPGAPVSEGVKE